MPHFGPSAFLAMDDERQQRILAIVESGRMCYAAETLFLPFPTTPRIVPEGNVWQYNHPELGTLDVALDNLTADPNATVTVRGLGYFGNQPVSDPDGTKALTTFRVKRHEVFGGPFTAERGLLIS